MTHLLIKRYAISKHICLQCFSYKSKKHSLLCKTCIKTKENIKFKKRAYQKRNTTDNRIEQAHKHRIKHKLKIIEANIQAGRQLNDKT